MARWIRAAGTGAVPLRGPVAAGVPHAKTARGRQVRQELAPAADALTIILGAGVGDFVHGVQQQQERAAPKQLGQAGKPRVALRPLFCQPVARRRRIAPGPRRAVAAEGEEKAERGIAARAAQGVQRQVQLQPAQQGALAAAGRAQQDQRRGISFVQHVPEIVERLGPGLGLPADALGLRPLVQQEGQAGETLVEIKAGLGTRRRGPGGIPRRWPGRGAGGPAASPRPAPGRRLPAARRARNSVRGSGIPEAAAEPRASDGAAFGRSIHYFRACATLSRARSCSLPSSRSWADFPDGFPCSFFLPDRAWRSITPFPRNDVPRIDGQDGAVSIVNSGA